MAVRIEKELKRDLFGCVELVRVEGPGDGAGDGTREVTSEGAHKAPVRPERRPVRLVRRVVTGRLGVGLVAGALARREAKALEHLRQQGVRGIAAAPELSEATLAEARSLETLGGIRPDPRRVHLRPFAEGEPLHLATELPLDFFDLLAARVAELHAAGVCHNDLHKEQNVVVGANGAPVLIDFQLATLHPRRSGKWFRARCRDDIRHIQKHRRRYTRDGRGPAALRVLDRDRIPRRGIALVWMKSGKPVYKFVTRRMLRTRDGEETRPSSGPWPRWTEPIGDRTRSAGKVEEAP